MSRRERVLMVAYACEPSGTGEHLLGWGWAYEASKDHDVVLITRPHGGEKLVDEARKAGIELHLLSVPQWYWKLTQLLGGLGSWLRIYSWQKRMGKLAVELHRRQPFDLVHQTTFHSFRSPFAATALPIPSVWGPIAGGEGIPPGFGRFLGEERNAETIRSLINRLSLYMPWVRSALEHSSAILVSNRTTLNFLPPSCRNKSLVVPANAIEGLENGENRMGARSGGRLDILYAGNCVARRGMLLAMAAMRELPAESFHLTIAGDGTALSSWRRSAEELDLLDRVTFTGKVGKEELAALYAKAHVFLFPSLRDSGGSALVEAMSLGIPVVCLDWGGPAEMVGEGCGVKLGVSDPEASVAELIQTLKSLKDHPDLREGYARKAKDGLMARFSWQAKREMLVEIYARLTHESGEAA